MEEKSKNDTTNDTAALSSNLATDLTSFASILAGVQRMRDQYKAVTPNNENTPKTNNNQQNASPKTSQSTQKNQLKPPVTARPLQDDLNSGQTISGPSFPSTSRPPPITSRPPPSTSRPSPITSRPPPSTSPQPAPSVRSSTATTRILAPQDILVSKSQTGNPLLKESMMKLVPWKFDSTILSDYYINSTFQIIFLSLKYHKLRPEYIWQRLKKLNKGSSEVLSGKNDRVLRILLTVVDIDAHQEILRKLLDFCIKHDLTLVLAWTFEEAGNYIALAKQLDNAPMKTVQNIRGVRATDFNSSVINALTEIRLVNKTDVSNLLANCKSVKNIVEQSCAENVNLGHISGLGSTKLNAMKRIFTEPFIYNKKYKPMDENDDNDVDKSLTDVTGHS
jgi:DNA excision repair protein ERCC-1